MPCSPAHGVQAGQTPRSQPDPVTCQDSVRTGPFLLGVDAGGGRARRERTVTTEAQRGPFSSPGSGRFSWEPGASFTPRFRGIQSELLGPWEPSVDTRSLGPTWASCEDAIVARPHPDSGHPVSAFWAPGPGDAQDQGHASLQPSRVLSHWWPLPEEGHSLGGSHAAQNRGREGSSA